MQQNKHYYLHHKILCKYLLKDFALYFHDNIFVGAFFKEFRREKIKSGADHFASQYLCAEVFQSQEMATFRASGTKIERVWRPARYETVADVPKS